MSKYLDFQQELNFKGKTKRFLIISKSSGDTLGKIQWYPQWRQYTFSPGFPTVWNRDCLKDIQDFLQKLMDERKNLNITVINHKGKKKNVKATVKDNDRLLVFNPKTIVKFNKA